MTSQRDTLGWLKQGARALAFGDPLYGLTLGGRGVTGLATASARQRSVAGRLRCGRRIMDGIFPFAGEVMQADEPVWVPHFGYGPTGSPPCTASTGCATCARRRRRGAAAGPDADHKLARSEPRLELRLLGAPIVLGRVSPTGSRSTISTARAPTTPSAPAVRKSGAPDQTPSQVVPGSLPGCSLAERRQGLVVSAGLCLPGCEKALGQALRLLDRELPAQVLPDGGHIERNPERHMLVLRT